MSKRRSDDTGNGNEPTTTCAGCGKTINASNAPLCDACIDAGE